LVSEIEDGVDAGDDDTDQRVDEIEHPIFFPARTTTEV
jgi:hypothetical protein